MKKNISLLYRLTFIIFAVWGLIEYCDKTTSIFSQLAHFAPAVILLCLLCIIPVFILSLKNTSPAFLIEIKGGITLLSSFLLIMYSHLFFAFENSKWILCILLPIMLILDWLLFDKKGSFMPRDLIIWLGIFAGIILLSFFMDIPFLSDILNFLKTSDNLFKLIFSLLGLSLILYLLDSLMGSSKKNNQLFNSTLLRLIFISLEIFCIWDISSSQLTRFINSFKYYSLFINFLCLLCIVITVLSCLIKSRKNSSPFPRIKGCLTSNALLVTIFFGVYTGSIFGNGLTCLLLCVVCPIIILADCLIYDEKKAYKLYDPFLWMIIPVLHFGATYFVLKPYFDLRTYSHLSYNPLTVFLTALGVQILLGYIMLVLNKFKK